MEAVLIVCGAIITISGAIGAVAKYIVKPLNELVKLKDDVEELKDGQKIMMRALAQTMEHLCSGNNIEELKEQYDILIDYCIKK